MNSKIPKKTISRGIKEILAKTQQGLHLQVRQKN